MILPDWDAPVLTRELIYTAITRARKSVTVWGEEELFIRAVSRRSVRSSGLRDALWKGRHEGAIYDKEMKIHPVDTYFDTDNMLNTLTDFHLIRNFQFGIEVRITI
jgi:hypothetical protein